MIWPLTVFIRINYRSGSSNPLCISESEDTSTPTKTNAFFPKLMVPLPPSVPGMLHNHPGSAVIIRRPNVLLKSPSMDSESSDPIIGYHIPGRFPKVSGAERRLLMASR